MLTNTLIFFLLALHSFVPGLLLRCVIKVNGDTFLVSFALSIATLTLTHFLSRAAHLATDLWLTFYYGFILLGLIIIVVQRRTLNLNCRILFSWVLKRENYVFLGLATLFLIYQISVGPYSEIPSDYWQHVARVQADILNTKSADLLAHNLSFFQLGRDANPFYQSIALLASALNVNAIEISYSVSLFFSLCFLAAMYFFTYHLAVDNFRSQIEQISVAVISTITTFLWLGTASFSYVRYYSFAPSIVNMVVLFSAIIIFKEHMDRRDTRIVGALMLPFLLLTMILVHIQEALFLILVITGLAILNFINALRTASNLKPTKLLLPAIWSSGAFLFWLVLASVAALALEIKSWGYTPHTIDLGSIFGMQVGLPIVNPAFRLWDTVGLFGIVVGFWYLFSRKHFRSVEYIDVTLILPLVTCLNPAFVWLFLHFAASTVAWRITYLMPMGIIFGFIVVRSAFGLKQFFTLGKSLRLFVLGGIAIISLLPIKLYDYENRVSRFPSILNNSVAAGYPLFADLVEMTATLSERHNVKHFLTDSVTGFVLYAGLRGEIRHWLLREYFPKGNVDYQQDLINSDFSRYLLILNQRDGEITNSARLAGHWEPNILQISRQYPNQLRAFLKSRPDRFKLVWEREGISTYLVRDLAP